MKFCPKCNTIVEDGTPFCVTCGTKIDENNAAIEYDTSEEQVNFDHTPEFEADDISENKVIAMIIYLCPIAGILIALFYQNKSPYVAFHLKQALKIFVIELLVSIVAILLWFFVLPVIAAMLIYCALYILRIVLFFNVCKNQAKEVPIIRNFKFMN